MQWLRLHTAVDAGSVSGWETKMPQAVRQKKKKIISKGSLDLVPALNIFYHSVGIRFKSDLGPKS